MARIAFRRSRDITRRMVLVTCACAAAATAGCDTFDPLATGSGAFYNLFATRRGDLIIGFVNNTTARAVFTFGGYDATDENTSPTFGQLRLNANSSSTQISQSCRRVFSVGGIQLVQLIRKRGLALTDSLALIEGKVNFSTAPANSPLATEPTEGTADAMTIDLGVDYLCDGLLLFTFESDATAVGGFRIDYRYFPR